MAYVLFVYLGSFRKVDQNVIKLVVSKRNASHALWVLRKNMWSYLDILLFRFQSIIGVGRKVRDRTKRCVLNRSDIELDSFHYLVESN